MTIQTTPQEEDSKSHPSASVSRSEADLTIERLSASKLLDDETDKNATEKDVENDAENDVKKDAETDADNVFE